MTSAPDNQTANDSAALLTVEDCARLWGVGLSTARDWLRNGKVPVVVRGGVQYVEAEVARDTKLLGDTELMNLPEVKASGADDRDLAKAIAVGCVVATVARHRRFSLADGDRLVQFKRGEWKPSEATTVRTPPVLQKGSEALLARVVPRTTVPGVPDEHLLRAGRWEAIYEYITSHGDPSKLPPTFWETRTCPEFIPPAGVFHFIYWRRGDDEVGWGTAIKRSAGWWVDESGTLLGAPEDEGHELVDEFSWPPGKEPPEYAAQNLRWRTLRDAWEGAWRLRRRQMRAAGEDPSLLAGAAASERRDRVAILRRYHEECWSPSALADWFWDTETCPRFDPPTDVMRLEYGKPGEDESSGELGTWIRRTATWAWVLGPMALELQAGTEEHEWVRGSHPQGEVPPKYEAQAREYDAAKLEWDETWRWRQRERRGEP